MCCLIWRESVMLHILSFWKTHSWCLHNTFADQCPNFGWIPLGGSICLHNTQYWRKLKRYVNASCRLLKQIDGVCTLWQMDEFGEFFARLVPQWIVEHNIMRKVCLCKSKQRHQEHFRQRNHVSNLHRKRHTNTFILMLKPCLVLLGWLRKKNTLHNLICVR